MEPTTIGKTDDEKANEEIKGKSVDFEEAKQPQTEQIAYGDTVVIKKMPPDVLKRLFGGLETDETKDIELPGGYHYQGGWKGTHKHGLGVLTYPDGSFFEGQFVMDNIDGKGKMTYPDGDYYIGEWRKGRADGAGAYDQRTRGGFRYEGFWKNDRREGYGEETLMDGSKYQGEWKKGMRSGLGRLSMPDGTVHQGQFRQNFLQGVGTTYFTNGDRYSGRFRKNLRSGKGKWTWSDGSTFIGNFSKGLRSGYGYFLEPTLGAMGLPREQRGPEGKLGGQWKEGELQINKRMKELYMLHKVRFANAECIRLAKEDKAEIKKEVEEVMAELKAEEAEEKKRASQTEPTAV
eukprot:gnl/TRDRNA2_/TRDRNA2_80380_c0_seq1.p1 gnl/TRDRNA2_/TRDRNA2_80380_c0~~gnl/TRDRNA2_/TRDRNA2_80380_c0_seq1.p1  ORF type:complete len:347 (-),score=78.26 gnl/TRDRNA2_/TRDRNA2_80380_c0_seq1:107-1147(-)